MSRTSSTPADGTQAIDENPPVPDFSDLTAQHDGNGHYDQFDLRVSDLERWLTQRTYESVQDAIGKAREYGGDSNGDLDIMAGAMRTLVPALQNHEQALAAVLAFYQLGKVSRSLAALANGRMPSPDTPRDTHVYAMMQLRVQETGRWL